MVFLKELWTLIKLLFTKTPKSYNELEVVKMNYFPFKGFFAMSWCGKLITRTPEKVDQIDITHETIHLKQAQQYSNWFTFYLRYLWEWIKGNPITAPSISAYYTIPFEVEAFANEKNAEYPQNYTPDNLKTKYTLRHRKMLYKRNGESPYLWRMFVREL